jgi:hypothetical protein
MESATYSNFLSIRFDAKAVPYGPDPGPREDGSQNFGFKNVKCNANAVAEIPELATDPALKSILLTISGAECGLFSIGCLSHDLIEPNGHQVTGYLEFAINSKALAGDAQNYFKLFFDFGKFLRQNKFDQRVALHWELRPATFHEVNAFGMTCSIIVNTHFHPSMLEARECWNESLAALEVFLANYPVRNSDPLY